MLLLFWKGLFFSKQPSASTYKDLLKPKPPALEGRGRSAKGRDILWPAFLSVAPEKRNVFFCFGGCLPLLGKPWPVGRTFPGTDFMRIPWQWLSPSSASPAARSHRPCCAWDVQSSLHSHCIPVPALICGSALTGRSGAGRKGGNACSFRTPGHLHIFIHCSLSCFPWVTVAVHSASLVAPSLGSLCDSWALQWVLSLSTTLAPSSVFAAPSVPCSWRQLQSLLLECRARCTPVALGTQL